VIDAKGTIGYCASNRTDSKGGLDLYSFEVYPAIQPVPTLCLKGFLMDKYYKSHLLDRPIYFTYTFNQTRVSEQNSNEGDGSFAQALQLGKTYLISVIEDGYRPYYKLLKLTSDSLPDNLIMDIRLRQPGFVDTLFQDAFDTDSLTHKPDSIALAKLDSLASKWSIWAADSAFLHIFIKGYYYSGDTITDTCFARYVQECQLRLDQVTGVLNKKGIQCDIIMQDMDMLIYTDDRQWFNKVEMSVVEYY
jgi:hypothetical protein